MRSRIDTVSSKAFTTAIDDIGNAIVGPWRKPRQMLAEQEYDEHASIHDDSTAQKLGFKGGTIEGPTHFSQFSPLGEKMWGNIWFESGCISAHYRNPVFHDEEVRSFMSMPALGERQAAIWMEKRDGSEVLRGTMSVGPAAVPTALDVRLTSLPPLNDPVILRDVKIGMKAGRKAVKMDFDQNMGVLYPFSLNQKLGVITEPCTWYDANGGEKNPWRRPVIPMEMLSVLFQSRTNEDRFPVQGPAVGLFADQEIRLLDGPLFVGETYEAEREVIALSGSRKTESMWVRTTVYSTSGRQVATMLLNLATIKSSYDLYETEYGSLYSAAISS